MTPEEITLARTLFEDASIACDPADGPRLSRTGLALCDALEATLRQLAALETLHVRNAAVLNRVQRGMGQLIAAMIAATVDQPSTR